MIRFLPLGGAGEIGASCFYLEIENTGIILDSGLHPQRIGLEALPQFEFLEDRPVDIVLISHAHQDHIGSLPYLVQRHPYVRIVTTPQTRAITELTLHNAVSILQEQLKDSSSIKAYTHDEVDLLVQSVEWKAYGEKHELIGYRHQSNDPIVNTFYDAGHILGSAGILLEHDGRKIFYSGDTRLTDQSLQSGALLPSGPVDFLILECTHGATDSRGFPLWHDESIRLAKHANHVLSRGGSVLIPVFALGKLQEMLSTLWNLMEHGILSKVELYTGGIGQKINTVYDKNRYVVRRVDPELELNAIPQRDLYDIERIEDLTKTPGIVLASSGMVIEGTLSFRAAEHWLKQHESAIFVVGYMDPETPGYRIANSSRGSLIQLTDVQEPRNVSCSIERFRFTAHSPREGLIHIVKCLQPRHVILIHGDEAAIDWMGHTILKTYPSVRVSAAENGKLIELQ